jgi:hypothetical protein
MSKQGKKFFPSTMFALMFTFHDPYVCANIRVWAPTDDVTIMFNISA